MNIQMSSESVILIVFFMAVVTIITRWGGAFVMGFIPLNKGMQRFISAMGSSVLVAILAPMAVKGDLGVQCALLMTVIVMLIWKKPLVASTAGVCTAAILRFYF